MPQGQKSSAQGHNHPTQTSQSKRSHNNQQSVKEIVFKNKNQKESHKDGGAVDIKNNKAWPNKNNANSAARLLKPQSKHKKQQTLPKINKNQNKNKQND